MPRRRVSFRASGGSSALLQKSASKREINADQLMITSFVLDSIRMGAQTGKWRGYVLHNDHATGRPMGRGKPGTAHCEWGCCSSATALWLWCAAAWWCHSPCRRLQRTQAGGPPVHGTCNNWSQSAAARASKRSARQQTNVNQSEAASIFQLTNSIFSN